MTEIGKMDRGEQEIHDRQNLIYTPTTLRVISHLFRMLLAGRNKNKKVFLTSVI